MHHLFPCVPQWLILLRPHLGVHVLVECSRHLYKGKTLFKKKKKRLGTHEKVSTDELRTYSFFLQC